MHTALIVIAFVLVIWFVLHRSGNPTFWKIVRQRPDIAFPWFESEGCWVIVRPGEKRPPANQYTAGFAVADPSTGEIVKVHCLRDQIAASQARFMALYGQI